MRRDPANNVIVIEKNDAPGQETSRFNSGVIHSGIHLPPEFLKAKLASRGSKLTVEYCRRSKVAHDQVGMYIVVAPESTIGWAEIFSPRKLAAFFKALWSELVNLKRMLRNAKALGIAIKPITGKTMRRREPNVRCLFAIHIPEVYIIDAEGLVRSLELEARQLGAQFHYNETVLGFDRAEFVTFVQTERDSYQARVVINAAGLFATEVAEKAGYDPEDPRYKQSYYRGEYYEILPESGIQVKALVYPVRKPGKPGLGTHLTPKIDGRLFIGPNAVAAGHNQDYDADFVPADRFYEDVKPFLPGLKIGHLRQGYCGIRPKLGNDPKEKDFSINFDTDGQIPMVNLIGIESPGLTAALAIAEYVANELRARQLP